MNAVGITPFQEAQRAVSPNHPISKSPTFVHRPGQGQLPACFGAKTRQLIKRGRQKEKAESQQQNGASKKEGEGRLACRERPDGETIKKGLVANAAKVGRRI